MENSVDDKFTYAVFVGSGLHGEIGKEIVGMGKYYGRSDKEAEIAILPAKSNI